MTWELRQLYFWYIKHTILINSDIKTHFKHNIKKCALWNKEILHIKFNYDFISVSDVNNYVNGLELLPT